MEEKKYAFQFKMEELHYFKTDYQTTLSPRCRDKWVPLGMGHIGADRSLREGFCNKGKLEKVPSSPSFGAVARLLHQRTPNSQRQFQTAVMPSYQCNQSCLVMD